jgi:hypothetical protein
VIVARAAVPDSLCMIDVIPPAIIPSPPSAMMKNTPRTTRTARRFGVVMLM